MSSPAFGAPTPLLCESCGTAFACGAGTGACWCAAVPTEPRALDALRAEFARCLCPDCLQARAGVTPPG